MRSVYVASRATEERAAMWRELRSQGWNISSTWIDEAGPGQTADLDELWGRIRREIAESDGLILYAKTEDFPLKGALVEAGMAIGFSKLVVIVLPEVELEERSCRPIGSWINHYLVRRAESVHSALAKLCGKLC